MQIQAVTAEATLLHLPRVEDLADIAVIPAERGTERRASRLCRNPLGSTDRVRREILAEALLDGFLGDDNADYEGLVKFTRKLRDHSPALAVQLLKPLLRTEATPSVNVEQQAIFIFGDIPKESTPDNKSEAIDVE